MSNRELLERCFDSLQLSESAINYEEYTQLLEDLRAELSKPSQSEDNSSREEFEEQVFKKKFISTISRPNDSNFLLSVDCPTKAEFIAKNEDGSYKEESLNPAWWAWQKAHSFYKSKLAEAEKGYHDLYKIFNSAYNALKSYQYGNESPELAEEITARMEEHIQSLAISNNTKELGR